ncbi:hypothetical protein SAMN05421752_11051 [Natronorubrum thiooxidans]|uniref:Uncharacterized protein n=1 Tax=Natronorubrum thiooxidans TaxID=308853 RepID=A0A1N7G713_9EURY|nr:hypothetical protein SAMN05421752_11051 [Natronorubrum thiooxidans]
MLASEASETVFLRFKSELAHILVASKFASHSYCIQLGFE